MQTLPREHKVSINLDSLVIHKSIRGLKINPTKIQYSSNSVKCLGVQWCRVFRDINSKVKDKSLHLATPTTKKEAQQLVGLLRFWRQHTPHKGVLNDLVHQVAQKDASFMLRAHNRKIFCNRTRVLCRLLCQFYCQIGMLFGVFGRLLF